MKKSIVPIGDISLHKEVYETRPNAFFAIFIYGVFIMVGVALAWAYFGHMDIVVRGTGIIRPYTEIATVITPVSGEVISVNFHDGMSVNRGDVLLEIDRTSLENERVLLTERLESLVFQLETLELYHQSLEEGRNLLGDFNLEYSTRIEGFFINISSIEHSNMVSSRILSSEMDDLQALLSQTNFELDMVRLLLQSIDSEEDLFLEIEEVAELEEFVEIGEVIEIEEFTEVEELTELEMELWVAYRNQYLNFATNMQSHDFFIATIEESLDGNLLIRASIEMGENLFEGASIYQSVYEEFRMRYNQLRESYAFETENYDRLRVLYVAGAIAAVEVNQATVSVEAASFNLNDFSSRFMININNEIRDLENRLISARNQREMLYIETVTNWSSQVIQLENRVQSLSQSISSNQLNRQNVWNVGSELGDVTLTRLSEINSTLNRITLLEQQINDININISTIDAQLELSVLRSPIDGYISANVELMAGSFLLSGTNLMSIVPVAGERLTANIFINNSDIGRLEEGMLIRYNIPAMPRRDFGDITGSIYRIAPDIVSGQTGYFLLEAILDETVFYDNHGNLSSLRVGMGFEARIVVDRQRVIFYLLDIVNLWLG